MYTAFALFFALLSTVVRVDSFQHCKKMYDAPSSTSYLVCDDLTDEMQLYDELKSVADVTDLQVVNSSLRYFIHGTFHRTNIRAIKIEGSSLLSFTNSDVAFDGLQDHLYMLALTDCTFVNRLDWEHLKNMRKLALFTVKNTDLIYIPEMNALAGSPKLSIIDMGENQISDIHPKAFSQWKSMTFLSLAKNEISSFERTMLPSPAQLVVLDLSHNLLQVLPDDMFSNMPGLRTIMLGDNQLTTISERIFGIVFSQLSVLAMEGNPMTCDCRLRWILQANRKPHLKLHSLCESPAALKGSSILGLKATDLWC